MCEQHAAVSQRKTLLARPEKSGWSTTWWVWRLFYLVDVDSQPVIEDNHLLSFTRAGAEEFLVLGCSHVQIHGRFSTGPNTYHGSCTHTDNSPMSQKYKIWIWSSYYEKKGMFHILKSSFKLLERDLEALILMTYGQIFYIRTNLSAWPFSLTLPFHMEVQWLTELTLLQSCESCVQLTQSFVPLTPHACCWPRLCRGSWRRHDGRLSWWGMGWTPWPGRTSCCCPQSDGGRKRSSPGCGSWWRQRLSLLVLWGKHEKCSSRIRL